MATPAHTTQTWRFGVFEVDAQKGELRRAGVPIKMREQSLRILVFLLQHAGEIVTREELRHVLWPADTFVDFDHSLNTAVMKLREALGDTADKPLYIETVPKRGYRFIAPVSPATDLARAPSPDVGTEFEQSRGTDRAGPPPTNRPTAGLSVGSGAVQEQRREVSAHQRLRARKILFAGVAAALLLFATVFIFRRFRNASSAPTHNAPRLAIEQRLTANPSDVPVHDAVVSPDGKYFAYADPTGLYLRQISSGETRRLGLPKDFAAWPRGWYPDGTHLLVERVPPLVVSVPLQLAPPYFSRVEPSLYKLSILGGEPQEIMSDAWAGYLSPDGSRIAYLPLTNRGDLWIMDSEGANARKVVSSPQPKQGDISQNWIYDVAWSPTGQYLAYIERDLFNADYSLRIVDADGRGPALVLDDARLGAALWWGPDKRILFSYREDAASAQDNYGVYSIGIDERTRMATGPPQPITRAEGFIGGMTGTADGKRLVLWRFRTTPQVFISAYDVATRQWKEPRRLTLDANENIATAWTADSKAVLFVSNRNGTWKLFKQSIDETTPDTLAEVPSISLPRLSADGTQVLYLSSSHPENASFPVALMSKPVAGGTPRVILQEKGALKGALNHQCAMAPATLCILSQADGDADVFRTFDLEHGSGRELLRLPSRLVNWSLSSDGSKLALFVDRHRIRFFSIATGTAHDVTVKDWPLLNGDWGSNGQTVFMPSRSPDGNPVILEVDQTGKAKVVLQGRADTDFLWMIQSPDSRHAVVLELTPTDNNAWILNDF